MRLGLARAKAAFLAMRCREIWALGPAQSRALLRPLFANRPASAPSGTLLYVNGPVIGTPSFRRHLRGIGRLARGCGVPLVAHVSVTDRCPCRCERCSNATLGDYEPPLDSLLEVIERLREAGTASVAFTGGEPMLRDDLPQLVRACGSDFSTFLFTTGHRLDHQRAGQLRAAGLTAVYISLDDSRAEEHDRARQCTGVFDQALHAIRASLAAGLYTAVQAVAGPEILRDGAAERFAEFCRGLGVHEVLFLDPMPTCHGEMCRGLDPTGHDRLRRLHERSARDASLSKIATMSFLEGPEFLGCQAGYSFLYVTARGDVCPCDFVPFSFGNLHETPWSEILTRLKRQFETPSRRCLALYLREENTARTLEMPVPWEHTRECMKNYAPGDLPELMRGMLGKKPE